MYGGGRDAAIGRFVREEVGCNKAQRAQQQQQSVQLAQLMAMLGSNAEGGSEGFHGSVPVHQGRTEYCLTAHDVHSPHSQPSAAHTAAQPPAQVLPPQMDIYAMLQQQLAMAAGQRWHQPSKSFSQPTKLCSTNQIAVPEGQGSSSGLQDDPEATETVSDDIDSSEVTSCPSGEPEVTSRVVLVCHEQGPSSNLQAFTLDTAVPLDKHPSVHGKDYEQELLQLEGPLQEFNRLRQEKQASQCRQDDCSAAQPSPRQQQDWGAAQHQNRYTSVSQQQCLQGTLAAPSAQVDPLRVLVLKHSALLAGHAASKAGTAGGMQASREGQHSPIALRGLQVIPPQQAQQQVQQQQQRAKRGAAEESQAAPFNGPPANQALHPPAGLYPAAKRQRSVSGSAQVAASMATGALPLPSPRLVPSRSPTPTTPAHPQLTPALRGTHAVPTQQQEARRMALSARESLSPLLSPSLPIPSFPAPRTELSNAYTHGAQLPPLPHLSQHPDSPYRSPFSSLPSQPSTLIAGPNVGCQTTGQILRTLVAQQGLRLVFKRVGQPERVVEGLEGRVQLVQLPSSGDGAIAGKQGGRLVARVVLQRPEDGSVVACFDGASPLDANLVTHLVHGCVAWDSGKGWLLTFSPPAQPISFCEGIKEAAREAAVSRSKACSSNTWLGPPDQKHNGPDSAIW